MLRTTSPINKKSWFSSHFLVLILQCSGSNKWTVRVWNLEHNSHPQSQLSTAFPFPHLDLAHGYSGLCTAHLFLKGSLGAAQSLSQPALCFQGSWLPVSPPLLFSWRAQIHTALIPWHCGHKPMVKDQASGPGGKPVPQSSRSCIPSEVQVWPACNPGYSWSLLSWAVPLPQSTRHSCSASAGLPWATWTARLD